MLFNSVEYITNKLQTKNQQFHYIWLSLFLNCFFLELPTHGLLIPHNGECLCAMFFLCYFGTGNKTTAILLMQTTKKKAFSVQH